jgi:hypothetical protein
MPPKSTVYFVGAGLTKSLEAPGRPLPLINDFVSVMAEYVHDDVILTTLAQLENFGIFEWPSQEASKFAKLLVGRHADRTQQDRSAFRTALKNRPSESIEKLLERASASGELHQRFKYAINRLSWSVDWKVNCQPLDHFLSQQIGDEQSIHTFISFNYDLLLERAFQHHPKAVWNPQIGYGFLIDYFVTEDPPRMQGAGFFSPTEIRRFQGSDIQSQDVQILKHHGSLNWLVPEKTPVSYGPIGLTTEGGPIVQPLTESHEIRYWSSMESFQWLRLPDEGTPRNWWLYIVPPTEAAKRGAPSFLADIRAKEMQAIKRPTKCTFWVGAFQRQTATKSS